MQTYKGGRIRLGLPQFKYYYWAANLSIFAWWKKRPLNADRDPSWLRMEQAFCNKMYFAALLNNPRIDPALYDNHFAICNVLKIQWWQIVRTIVFSPAKNGFKTVISIFCCSVSVGNISLHFQTFFLPLIGIIQ